MPSSEPAVARSPLFERSELASGGRRRQEQRLPLLERSERARISVGSFCRLIAGPRQPGPVKAFETLATGRYVRLTHSVGKVNGTPSTRIHAIETLLGVSYLLAEADPFLQNTPHIEVLPHAESIFEFVGCPVNHNP